MPAVSRRQERFMQAVAHDPKFAAEVKVPQSVGREFVAADERKEGAHKVVRAMMSLLLSVAALWKRLP